MLPSVNITELDGSLGILPSTDGGYLAIVGPCSAGPLNTPVAYARVKDLVAAYVGGPAVEAAAYALEQYGRPVVMVRTATTTAGSYATIDSTGVTGTSVVTTTAATTPNDDYDLYFKVVAGGTRGTAGITFQWSVDGGRTLSAVTALGTAVLFAFPNTGGASISFAAGTLVAGDLVQCRTLSPVWIGSELTTALTALQNSQQPFEGILVTGPATGADYTTVASALTAMHNVNKHKYAVINFRLPTVGETDAAYQTAFNTAFGAVSGSDVLVCAGASKQASSISRFRYKRPVSFAFAPRAQNYTEEHDPAVIDDGALPGVAIVDANGNPDEHNEAYNPGLDASRAVTLRTWEGYNGVYITNPRILCATGSDFQFLQFRRVMNVARTVLNAYMIKRLSKVIQVNKKTGFIAEQDARDIESGANAVLSAALLTKPKASAVAFVLSRTDLILSTFTLNGTARIVPLGYPKTINVDVGFNNPGLRTSGV